MPLSKPVIISSSSSSRNSLPWLRRSPRRPEPQLAAGDDHLRISNASILLAIANPNSNPRQVLSLFSSAMRQRSFVPKLSTYASLLPFLVLRRRIRAAELLLRRLPLAGLRPGPSLLLPLASSALSAGIPSDSAAGLLLSASPSASAFSSLLAFVIRSDHLSLARSLLLFAGGSDELGFPLKVRHFGGLVRRYCVRGEVEEAEEMVALMGRRGVRVDAETWNALLATVCDCRGVDEGFVVFLEMTDSRGVSPDVITFTTLMGRMGMEGRVWECDALFGRMLVKGVLPDLAFYRMLVRVYCRNGMVSGVVRVLRAMEMDGLLGGGGIEEKSGLECGVEFEEVVLGVVLKRGVVGDFVR